MKETVDNLVNVSNEKLKEIVVTMHNVINHRLYYTNPNVWRDILAGNIPGGLDAIEAEYVVRIGDHEYEYYAMAEEKDGNITFNCLFEVDGMKTNEWEFLKLLFNSEEELVKRANKRVKDAR